MCENRSKFNNINKYSDALMESTKIVILHFSYG